MLGQLLLAGSLSILVAVSEAHAQALDLAEAPDHTTEATVTINATPEEVYNAVTDYANWRQVLTDIKAVRVLAGGRENARVRFKSRALEHTVTVLFDNVPNQLIRFRGVEGPPGGRARGEYNLEPVDGGKRTRVTARLYMDVKGPASWFVSDSKIREMRQTKLQADLTDVAIWFQSRR